MAPTIKRLVARVWFVACPTHGVTAAKTRDHWVNGFGQKVDYGQPEPERAKGSILEKLGLCQLCAQPGPLRLVRAYERAGQPLEECGEKCLNATGETCNCECLGACHGVGHCLGHDKTAVIA